MQESYLGHCCLVSRVMDGRTMGREPLTRRKKGKISNLNLPMVSSCALSALYFWV